jgi:SAM-dependent methyltransferase
MENVEKFRLLSTALEYEIFEHLTEPKTAAALSEKLETNPQMTTKFCNALTAMGFLFKNGNTYYNTLLSNTYLVKASSFNQRHLLNLERENRERRWSTFPKVLKQGSLKSERSTGGAFTRDFLLAMAEGALRGGLQKIVEIFSTIPEFKNAKTLADIGGGHGLYAIAFAQTNPQLEAYVVDFPHVINSITKEVISDYKIADRVHTIPCDFTQGDLGGKYDIVFASDSMYKPRKQMVPLLQKIASNLNNGGFFASKHWFLNEEKSGPLTSVFFDLKMSFEKHGEEPNELFTLGEYITALNQSGFQVQNVTDINGPYDPSKLVIAKRC